MRGTAQMRARVAALALAAALAAVAQAAWTGEEPPPFPGVSLDARQANAPKAPHGTAARTAPDTATAAAPGEPAGAIQRAAAARDRGPGAERDGPAGGSHLLRALAGRPQPDDMRAEDGAPVMAAESCPRSLLRRLLASAAGEADALSVLGIEREILTLCRERQEILAGLFEAEAALRELRAPPVLEATIELATPEPAPPAGIATLPQPTAPSPLRAAIDAMAEKPGDAEPALASYGWFSIVGSAGALRAGITDGSDVWFVREGDRLPGGASIAAIAARPPSVRMTAADGNGDATLLPYRGEPGGVP